MPLPDADAVAPSDPKELINAYLLSKGMQPTNALMSQALMANAQNPGVIPGLRNMEPISSPGDPGMPPAPARGGGKPAADTRPLPVPPAYVPPPGASDAAKGPDDRSIGARILDWLALPGAAAGNKYLLGGPQKPEPKQLAGPDERGGGGDGGRPAPVPERPMLPGGGQPALPAPEPRAPLGLPAPSPPNPLDAAISRATEPVPAEVGKGPPPAVPPVAEPKGTVSIVDPKTIKPRTNLNLPSALQGKGAAQLESYLRSIGRIHR